MGVDCYTLGGWSWYSVLIPGAPSVASERFGLVLMLISEAPSGSHHRPVRGLVLGAHLPETPAEPYCCYYYCCFFIIKYLPYLVSVVTEARPPNEEGAVVRAEICAACEDMEAARGEMASAIRVLSRVQIFQLLVLQQLQNVEEHWIRVLEGVEIDAESGIKPHCQKYEASLEDGALVSKVDEAKAIKTMKKGEKVLLTVKPQYAFGEKGRPASGGEGVVPPNATLLIELELLSWKNVTDTGDDKKVLKKILKEGEGYQKPYDGSTVNGINFSTLVLDKESWDMNTEETVEASARKKEEGNALFKLGKYQRAS
ncbi:70 kDa peptidyl-prolyl isomerase [Platanthera zijinensis]|uniref:peptidylprolyl isomerase n=1 Tax=Platanthera zijinensis TaxID=2320716 RepID=A0AAP0BE29_9ASPA